MPRIQDIIEYDAVDKSVTLTTIARFLTDEAHENVQGVDRLDRNPYVLVTVRIVVDLWR